MRKTSGFLGACLALGWLSCSPISVRTDFDREANFSNYQTFKWMPNPQKRKKGSVPRNSLLDKKIRRAVERELEAKGYEIIERGKADALLSYHVGMQQRVEIDRYGYGYWHRHVHVHRYKEGTIIIDVVDPEMKQLVWRGAAQGVVGHPEGNEEKINEAIAKVFEKYPPL
ncbi:MAG: DUF4136 domain-containing protein [bacterium]